jgi:hypothetical protein
MHDIHLNTVEALEQEIVSLKAQGARFVTVPSPSQVHSSGGMPRSRPPVIDREPAQSSSQPICCSSVAAAVVILP